ncbi:hypothetical protein Trydic_g21140 [Trypoxylus dichotomus]
MQVSQQILCAARAPPQGKPTNSRESPADAEIVSRISPPKKVIFASSYPASESIRRVPCFPVKFRPWGKTFGIIPYSGVSSKVFVSSIPLGLFESMLSLFHKYHSAQHLVCGHGLILTRLVFISFFRIFLDLTLDLVLPT